MQNYKFNHGGSPIYPTNMVHQNEQMVNDYVKDPQWLVVAQQAIEGAYDREMPDLLRTILEACWANPHKLTTQAGWRIERILRDRGEKLPVPPTQTLGEMMECYSAPPPWLVAKTVLDGDFDDDHPISLREKVEMMGDDQYPDCIAARQRIDGLLRKAA
jgi:hypothetical protein